MRAKLEESRAQVGLVPRAEREPVQGGRFMGGRAWGTGWQQVAPRHAASGCLHTLRASTVTPACSPPIGR